MQNEGTLPQVYAKKVCFWKTFDKKGYESVKRWTKNIDIFSKDILFFPINVNNAHWTLAVFNLKEEKSYYFDSKGGVNVTIMDKLGQYLKDEHRDKKKSELKLSTIKLVRKKNMPQQSNDTDCGIFLLKFAELYARKANFTFEEGDMPRFRNEMMNEIRTSQLNVHI